MRTSRPIVFALLLALPGLAVGADSPFYLKEGDRVVFYGDSITDQRLYTTFVETFAVTRFPKADVTFVHSGWGGDRVTGGGGGPVDVRLDRDVVAHKPTVVTIMLGMNDASYRPFEESIFNTYANGYRHIVEKLQGDLPGVRLTLIKPSPFDDVTRKPNFEEGYNAVLLRYGDFVKDLAEKSKADFADLNTPVVDATRKAYATDPDGAVRLNQDRIHPGVGGQLLMAYALLKAWNAPSLVSSVALEYQPEAKEPFLSLLTENANVKLTAMNPDLVQWTQTDESLPFPINLKDAPTRLAVRSSDIVDGLDRQVIKVAALKAENYALTIDDEEVGTFTKAQLAEGVNIATLATPMAKQAATVHQLTLRRAKLRNDRWREVQLPLQGYAKLPGYSKAIEGLDELEAALRADQRAAAQPKPHKFELKPKS